jgi:hypothetical protein
LEALAKAAKGHGLRWKGIVQMQLVGLVQGLAGLTKGVLSSRALKLSNTVACLAGPSNSVDKP